MLSLQTIEFFYIKFFYNPNYALVPRLETESLVREAIRVVKKLNINTLIDIGTGSGIIPISIEKNTSTLKNFFGLDISKNALKLAKINKENTNSKINLINSDLLKVFLDGELEILGDNILITANLPYIKYNDRKNMGEDLKNEPKLALFGGKKTGFELYIKFFKQVLKLKKLYIEKKIILICEFGFNQTILARDFFEKKNIVYKIFSDFSGVERFIYVEI